MAHANVNEGYKRNKVTYLKKGTISDALFVDFQQGGYPDYSLS